MSACEDQDPEQWAEWCPSCAAAIKDREAEAGLRCKSCLKSFDNKRYQVQSDTSPELCRSCERAANAPRSTRGATYGAGRYREQP